MIELLGYVKQRKTSGELAYYAWYQNDIDGLSLSGVELSVHKNKKGFIEVDTRTSISRGYWDVKKQCQTMRAIRDYFGGKLSSDYSNGWVEQSGYEEPTKLEEGLYVARWRFHNNTSKVEFYLSCRDMKGFASNDKPSGLSFMDDINPRFLSNALLIPYCVAIWEDYLKSSYLMILRHSDLQDKTMTKISLDSRELSDIIQGRITLEEILVSRMSFQRPRIVVQNFTNLGVGLDIGEPLKKPYNRRKKSLFDSIDEYVDIRNEIAHTGSSPKTLTDSDVISIAKDFSTAVDRIYRYLGAQFDFEPRYDF